MIVLWSSCDFELHGYVAMGIRELGEYLASYAKLDEYDA